MRIEGLEPVALAAAGTHRIEAVLTRVVEGLVDQAGLALARIWLTGLGDLCEVCPMRGDCLDQTLCLHLSASAGKPLVGPPTAWSRREGAFRRYPLGAGKIGRIATTGTPLLIADVARDDGWIANPAWARAEGIRSFAGHALLLRDEVMGVLGVFSRGAIDARGFEALRAFAAQVAVALANARAFEELARSRDAARLERDCLREELRAARALGVTLGESRALRTLREQIELAAPTDANVLIFGETGTGKAGVAQAIHDHSGRADAALVRVDCTAAPDALLRELFGAGRAGHLEAADGGTLFLDEVAALPLAVQARLLRTIEDGVFERFGESETRHTDLRVVAATNRDLRREVGAQRFREDLYYRLAVVSIEVPPLRHRRDEIGPLAAQFLAAAAARLGKPDLRLSLDDVAALEASDWPGNVRELESLIERAAVRARGASLELDALLAPPDAREARAAIETEAARKRRERSNIEAALAATNGRIYGPDGAAKLLGMKPTTLASRIKALGIGKRRG